MKLLDRVMGKIHEARREGWVVERVTMRPDQIIDLAADLAQAMPSTETLPACVAGSLANGRYPEGSAIGSVCGVEIIVGQTLSFVLAPERQAKEVQN